jgi:hypothetical protein
LRTEIEGLGHSPAQRRHCSVPFLRAFPEFGEPF